MDQNDSRVLEVPESGEDSETSVLSKRERLLGELAATVGISFGVTPIVATAIVTGIFQQLLKQFYEKGETYLPEFGLLSYAEDMNCQEFLPCESLVRNMDRMKEANESDRFTRALIEKRIAKLCHQTEK